jgi:hypothetical protein
MARAQTVLRNRGNSKRSDPLIEIYEPGIGWETFNTCCKNHS